MKNQQSKSFIELMKEIDYAEHVQRDRGTLFELLIKAYLKNEPMYRQLFDEVWMLKDVPDVYGIPKNDTGVDLVARKKDTSELVAIQCKYYDRDATISKGLIDSFLNEIGKKYYAEGIIVSSTDNWTNNAEEALRERSKPITRIGLTQLRDSRVDWSEFSFSHPDRVRLQVKKSPRDHQYKAIKAVLEGFETADRGKLIMAPGTGKTYTSMAIAESLCEKKKDIYRVLYLVPSIQLLSQSLRSWTGDTKYNMDTIAVCSDRKVTKATNSNEISDIAAADIGYPATTDYQKMLEYQKTIESSNNRANMLVVFSTYQSINVISQAQQEGFYDFDLIVADEAHRTTGSTKAGEEESAFVKVHSNENIKSSKRLYQTATPRIYDDRALQKAQKHSIVVADMNNPDTYGKEFYRLGFGEAVHSDILSDYKVMVLAVDESMVQKQFQQIFAQKDNELDFDDVTKIIGCWNGLLKRKSNSNELYGKPMKRAIAFTGTIAQSKQITEQFNQVVNQYLEDDENIYNVFQVEIEHADGTMNALQKNKKIEWLKSDVSDKTCRILSNARFLTEGVDVPDLDAVLFLQPRRSVIDIAQAVGRVMRKVEGKNYGYVILPIGVPSGNDANEVLDKNENYQVVWQVLNALRSIDERFDAMVNKIELNKKKPKLIDAIGVGGKPEVDEDGDFVIKSNTHEVITMFETLDKYSGLERAIYGKIVQKVGNIRYWESWSRDVSELAQQHITRICAMLDEKDSDLNKAFKKFLKGLRNNINDSISKQDAIEMLAQHTITKPVFDVLFEQESFAINNPVSKTMNEIIAVLESYGFDKEQNKLEGFYESVKIRARDIDNLEGKQKIIVQLYEKFFKIGFPRTTEKLGIVFTPIEVVDFIIHSVNGVLQKYFSKTLSDKNVNILDPFTGTGTFITRLLQSGLISEGDLLRKYKNEVFANEIVLLSYYIAAINIEETYKEISKKDEYVPFEGVVLTDTFETTERDSQQTFSGNTFKENNERLQRQQKSPITVIIGNPPYSIGQDSVNDNNQKNHYDKLDKSIEESYAAYSKSNLKKSLYDNYIRAFKWASRRIGETGVIGFVSNASFIDSHSTDGLRKCWHDEFNYIYIFNLRGDQRTVGEQSRKEGGKIFGSGSRAPIAVTILIKDGSDNHEIFYKDIGDYLNREEKLNIIKEVKSISNLGWTTIKPDNNNDWINQRNQKFNNFIPFISEDERFVFHGQYTGVNTARDIWVTGFSKKNVEKNSIQMVENYNSEVKRLSRQGNENKLKNVDRDETKIKWSADLLKKFTKGELIDVSTTNIIEYMHRPFIKKWLFYDEKILERPSRYKEIYKKMGLVLYVLGQGMNKDFSAIITNKVPSFQLIGNGKGFPEYIGKDTFGLSSNISKSFKDKTGLNDDEVMYLTYAILNSKEFCKEYANDLQKALPRIPLIKNQSSFVEIGKQLVNLHINYENVPAYSDVVIESATQEPSYKVEKMRFKKKRDSNGKSVSDKTKIIFNKDITVSNIPEKACEYVVNGRSAIEWIIDQYRVKTDKKSGITDNPNEYSDDPKYILNLLLSIINVSVQTVDLINSLPPLEIIEE